MIKNKLFCFIGIIIAVVGFIIDLISKQKVLQFFLHTKQDIIISDFFRLSIAWNRGISFSLFDSYGIYGTYILIAITLIIILILFLWLLKSDSVLTSCGLGFILGGALGNVYNRIEYNAVLDFILLHYKQFVWPIFNLADVFITIGAILLILESFKERNK